MILLILLLTNSPCKNGNPNTLTPDKGTSSLAQGPIAHTCMVEIRLAEGEIPLCNSL